MSVHVAPDAIYLEGRCLVDDAETLLVAIQQNPAMPINLGGAQRLHMAVAQVLLALKPPLQGVPDDLFLAHHFLGRSFNGDKIPKPA